MKPGYSGNIYQVYWKVWIDYNSDGDFDDAGELVALGTGTSQVCGNITIPACVSGFTRMRVVMSYGGYVSGPCCYFNSGEVEDYCVELHGSNVTGGGGSSEMRSIVQPGKVGNVLIGEENVALLQEEIFEASNNVEWTIYPNPVTEQLNIDVHNGMFNSIEIFDILGKKIWMQNVLGMDRIEILTEGWKPGAYLIKVNKSDQNSETRKFIKKD
jgi:hypothetical protein